MDARVLRLMFAMKLWGRSMNYTKGKTDAEAQSKDEDFESFFARAHVLIAKFGTKQDWSSREGWLVCRACPSLDDRVCMHLTSQLHNTARSFGCSARHSRFGLRRAMLVRLTCKSHATDMTHPPH